MTSFPGFGASAFCGAAQSLRTLPVPADHNQTSCQISAGWTDVSPAFSKYLQNVSPERAALCVSEQMFADNVLLSL